MVLCDIEKDISAILCCEFSIAKKQNKQIDRTFVTHLMKQLFSFLYCDISNAEFLGYTIDGNKVKIEFIAKLTGSNSYQVFNCSFNILDCWIIENGTEFLMNAWILFKKSL